VHGCLDLVISYQSSVVYEHHFSNVFNSKVSLQIVVLGIIGYIRSTQFLEIIFLKMSNGLPNTQRIILGKKKHSMNYI